MLERFVEIKTSIAEAIIDCGIDQSITRQEFEVLSDSKRVGAENLGSRRMTLLFAAGMYPFIVYELNERNSSFSKPMKGNFIKRISERRKKFLFDLMK